MQTIDNKVLSRIYGKKRGWCFTPTSFVDIGGRRTIDSILSRLTSKGTIRRLARGLYDYPRQDDQLGVLPPSIDAIAAALQASDGVRLQSSGAYAANLLGLSDQVPMKVVFLTDGPTRRLTVGKRQIQLKQTTPLNMATADRISGTVIQALRWLGQRHVDDQTVSFLKKRLSSKDKVLLLKDIRYAPIWIADIIRSVAGETRKS